MNDLRQRFGARIKERRLSLTALGTTADEITETCRPRETGDPPLRQDQIAAVLGVRQPAVSAWENGEAFPEAEKLFQLVRFLRISLGEIAAITDPATEAEAVAG